MIFHILKRAAAIFSIIEKNGYWCRKGDIYHAILEYIFKNKISLEDDGEYPNNKTFYKKVKEYPIILKLFVDEGCEFEKKKSWWNRT